MKLDRIIITQSMNGKTHEMIGLASVMVAYRNESLEATMTGCLIAFTAATIPDVDLIDNRKGKGIDMLTEVIKQSAIICGFGIYHNAELYKLSAWICLMILFVIQPHRGFTHGIEANIITSLLFIWMTDISLVKWYSLAYLSHTIIDLLNTKSVYLLFGYKKCFKVCKSGGILDEIIGSIAGITVVIMTIIKIVGIERLESLIKEVSNIR